MFGQDDGVGIWWSLDSQIIILIILYMIFDGFQRYIYLIQKIVRWLKVFGYCGIQVVECWFLKILVGQVIDRVKLSCGLLQYRWVLF